MVIAMNMVIGVFMAPFLIKKLGLSLYGIIALVNTFPSYIKIFSNGLSSSFMRYMTISFERKENSVANDYYCTALYSLFGVTVVLLPLIVPLIIKVPSLFDIPPGQELNSQLLIGMVVIATFASIFQSPFLSIFQLYHNFFSQNIILIVSKLFSLVVFVILFFSLSPNIFFVGIYQVGFSVITLVILVLFLRRNESIFSVKRGRFRFESMKEMGKLGFWNTLNDLASLLFLLVGQVLVYKLLGSKASGFFGPVLILSSLLMMGSGAISDVLMPIIYKNIAVQDDVTLISKVEFASRTLAYIVGLPIFVIICFAKFWIGHWLGADFFIVVPVIRIVLASLFFGGIMFLPYSHLYRGKDLMRVPAVTNLAFGVLQVILTFILLKYYNTGLIGFAYAFLLTFGIRGILFNGFYVSYIYKRRLIFGLTDSGRSIFKFVILLGWGFILHYCSYIMPVLSMLIFIISYIIFALKFGFKESELLFLKSLLNLKRYVKGRR